MGIGKSKHRKARPNSHHAHIPLRFHPHTFGANITLHCDGKAATRQNSFCHGITLSQRPVICEEVVYLRLSEVQTGWSGALRYGFTSYNPDNLSADGLPRFACPDLVSRPGFWVKALPEKQAHTGSLLAFWVSERGDLWASVGKRPPSRLCCGLPTSHPLWALVDVYGMTRSVELLDVKSTRGPPPSAANVISNTSADNFQNNRLDIASPQEPRLVPETAIRTTPIPIQQCVEGTRSGTTISPLNFHRNTTPNVTLGSGGSIVKWNGGPGHALIFMERTLQVEETVILRFECQNACCTEPMVLGITTCDPNALSMAELSAEPQDLLDRPEYWVVHPFQYPRDTDGFLQLRLSRDGRMQSIDIRSDGKGQTLFFVDASQSLWLFFYLQASSINITSLGSYTVSPLPCQAVEQSATAGCTNRLCSCSSFSSACSPCNSSPLSPDSFMSFKSQEASPSSIQMPDYFFNNECAICMDNPVDSATYGCGHMCVCAPCGKKLLCRPHPTCPICRQEIHDIIRIYRR
uniref:E3 ubiquitin-protein ligase NEURL1B-like n=2 Tax=Myxine glutinosa TaxID=7769 RepID=UPI00358FCF20